MLIFLPLTLCIQCIISTCTHVHVHIHRTIHVSHSCNYTHTHISQELFADIAVIKGNLCDNLSQLFSHAVDTICNAPLVKPQSVLRRFSWCIFATCCERIPIEKESLQWVSEYSAVTRQLGQVLQASTKLKCLGKETVLSVNVPLLVNFFWLLIVAEIVDRFSTMISSFFPDDSSLSPEPSDSTLVLSDRARCFQWVHKVKDIFCFWREKFSSKTIMYQEIEMYHVHQKEIYKLAETLQSHTLVLSESGVTSVKNIFLQHFEELNMILIKYIPGSTDAKWYVS